MWEVLHMANIMYFIWILQAYFLVDRLLIFANYRSISLLELVTTFEAITYVSFFAFCLHLMNHNKN